MTARRGGDRPVRDLVLYGVVFLLGVGMLVLIGWGIYYGLAPTFWDEVDCRIVSSTVTMPDPPASEFYVFEPRYSYRYHGVEHVGTVVAPGYSGDTDYTHVQELQRLYRVGTLTQCRVDPHDPSRAVLMPQVDWILLPLLIFPALFIIPGSLLFVGALRDLRRKPGQRGRGQENLIQHGGWILGLIFFGLMFFGGAAFWYDGFLAPAGRSIAAQGWALTPCTIVYSGYRTVLGEPDAPTGEYAPDILYTYRVGGKEYRSNRYDFQDATSGDLSFIQGIVDQHREGSTVMCHVDPDRPEVSVLEPGVNWILLLPSMVFPLPFMAVGVLGFWGMLGRLRECLEKTAKSGRRR